MVKNILTLISLLLVTFIYCHESLSKDELHQYRDRVEHMFYHAYNGYLRHAYPYDELRPITCDGHDTWGSYSLTLIDALDTLVVMGNHSEFRRVASLLIETLDFERDINVSVFETNIRVVGGLLSAHLMARRAGMELEEGWPCSGPLLRLAEKAANKLLPAFATKTGMPYGTVNLLHGVPKGETAVSCTAGVGTFLVEFGTLSRLTGNPVYERTALRALDALWKARSSIDLVGNHIDVQSGKWTALDAGIGAGVDSYFEYLVKGAMLLHKPELVEQFRVYDAAIAKYLRREDWHFCAHMTKGSVTLPVFQSLECFWPGLQSLVGDIEPAMATLHNYHQVARQFGFTPEFYNIPKAEAQSGREGYPLRPELIESVMYLYRATGDPYLQQVAVDILTAIESQTKTSCGYATVKNVNDHRLDNRMESFFLAETTKYLYLMFDQDNFLHNTGDRGVLRQTPGGSCMLETGFYVFNTEAHPIDGAALHCCGGDKARDDQALADLHDNIDLLTLFDLDTSQPDLFERRGKQILKSRAEEEIDHELKVLLSNNQDGWLHEDTMIVGTKVLKLDSAQLQALAALTGGGQQVMGPPVGGAVNTLQSFMVGSIEKAMQLLGKLAPKQQVALKGLANQVTSTDTESIGTNADQKSTKGETDIESAKSDVQKANISLIDDNSIYSQTSYQSELNESATDPNSASIEDVETDVEEEDDEEDGEEETCDFTADSAENEATVCSEDDSADNWRPLDFPSRLLTCPAKRFRARFSLLGEMFPER